MTLRSLKQIIPALETSDGAGVRIKRSIGQQQNIRLDPFLMPPTISQASPRTPIGGSKP